jgi:hypothetical protein
MFPSVYSATDRAQHDFNHMINRGTGHRLMNIVRRKSNQLLDFEVLREELHLGNQHDLGIQTVHINNIVGSLGRTHDFDDEFYPVSEDSRDRWCSVATALYLDKVLPPIELYQIDEQYFVIDGNHRVSVFKALGQSYIEAHVIAIDTVDERCQTQEIPSLHYER